MDDFTYSRGHVSAAALADLTPDFDSLQPSDYADGSYRLRRFSTLAYDRANKVVDLLPAHDFVQGDDINHFQGNVQRHYDDLLDSTWRSAGFVELVDAFAEAAELPERTTFEVHQIRVVSHAGEIAETAPEGVHQDGFDRICIVTLARVNTDGADLMLHQAQDAPALVTLAQQPGEYLVLNDSLLWHSATPVAGLDAGRPAYWDAFVLTANRA